MLLSIIVHSYFKVAKVSRFITTWEVLSAERRQFGSPDLVPTDS